MGETIPMAGPRSGETGATPEGQSSETLEALFLALEGALLGYALRLVRDAELAEDLVQEAFLRLHGQAATVREPRSWLYRTIHNLAMNHLRTVHRIVPLAVEAGDDAAEEEEAVDGQPLPDEQLLRLEGVGLVHLGLQGLDTRSRELVALKFQEHLSYKEISARTGLTVGHVGYLLHHALKSLSAELARAGLLS